MTTAGMAGYERMLSVQGITEAAAQPSRSLSIADGDVVAFRLLSRGGKWELYLNGYFAHCFNGGAVRADGTALLRLLGTWRAASDLTVYSMLLP